VSGSNLGSDTGYNDWGSSKVSLVTSSKLNECLISGHSRSLPDTSQFINQYHPTMDDIVLDTDSLVKKNPQKIRWRNSESRKNNTVSYENRPLKLTKTNRNQSSLQKSGVPTTPSVAGWFTSQEQFPLHERDGVCTEGKCWTTSFQATQRSILRVRKVAAFQTKMLPLSSALNTNCHTTVLKSTKYTSTTNPRNKYYTNCTMIICLRQQ